MADIDDKDTTGKRDREEEANDDLSAEPPAKQKKLTEDQKEETGVAVTDDSETAAGDDGQARETSYNNDKPTVSKDSTASDDVPVAATENALTRTSTPAPENSHVAPAPAVVPVSVSTLVQQVSLPPGLPPGIGASRGMDSTIEEKGTVSALYVGRVIGKGGEMIRDLQARSSCRIDVDQNVPQGQPRVITYRGTRSQIDFAKRLVHMLCQENASETDLPLGEAKQEYLMVPAQSVGKIIGRSGEMIRELQSRSHAKIQVDHQRHTGSDQKHVTITGSDLSVTKAKEMILFLVANPLMDAMQSLNMLVEDKLQRGGVWGSGPPYPNLPNMGQNMQPDGGGGGYGGYDQQPYYGGTMPATHPYSAAPVSYAPATPYVAPAQPMYQQYATQTPYGQYGATAGGGGGAETEVFLVEKQYMGRVIGKKGVTINDLQRRSSTDLQVNQDVPAGRHCEITIRGSRQGIEMAKHMLKEVIEIGPNHPYAGGGPPTSGFQSGGGYGQQAQYGYQNQGTYNQGYGMGYDQSYQAPVAAYGQPQLAYGQASYSAPPPIAAPQTSEWKSATSPDGQVYYYNERTGQTQWEKPAGML